MKGTRIFWTLGEACPAVLAVGMANETETTSVEQLEDVGDGGGCIRKIVMGPPALP